MKIEIMVGHVVATNPKGLKNVRRFKCLAKTFNTEMCRYAALGINKEFTPQRFFEVFETFDGELGLRPQALQFQRNWIAVKIRKS